MEGGQHPAQPTEDGDQIQVAQVDEQRIAKGEGTPRKERGGARNAQRPAERIDAQPGPPEMTDGQPLHPDVTEIRFQKKEEQIGQVEKTGLDVGDKGRAAVEGGIPEGQLAPRQCRRGEAVGGVEKADQIAAIRGLVNITGKGAPEEGSGQEGEEEGRDTIFPSEIGDGRWEMGRLTPWPFTFHVSRFTFPVNCG
ncbi:MAG: hypothetical protein DWI57_02450 [Chloroflexi bacterium]|nr:MAG: hypothetical protein DWI57_02450 [Chloroflexota bacterium]